MILFSLLMVIFTTFHPFYVSITSIDYRPERRALEVSSRLFYDDLEKALADNQNQKVDLVNPANRVMTDSLIARYLRKNLRLAINNKPVALRYLGYEIEEDVAWCFLESTEPISSIERMGIECELLYRQFNTQTNIFHLTVNKLRKSVKMDYPKTSAAVNFNN